MKRRNIIFIIILISIIFLIFSIKQSKKFKFQDDLIFFKFINQINIGKTTKEDKKTNEYKIKVSKQKRISKNIELMQIINTKNLINEKIAPGTKGNFEIVISSNENLKYQIGFISKNSKPKNLQFYLDESNKKNTLEELQENLKGEIQSGQIIKRCIYWEWNYETNEKEDRQDTKDGQDIKKYNFEIYTIGE